MDSKPRSSLSTALRTRITRRLRSRRTKRRDRHLRFESLEDRRLLAVDWRNPVNSLDVNDDGFISPVDALQPINELNSNGSHALAGLRPGDKPYWDASGDQVISPVDALQVINALNANQTVPYLLNEGQQIAAEQSVTITVGQTAGTRTYRLQVTPTFDTTDATASSDDLFAIYLVDPLQPSQTLLDRGTPGTTLFTLSEAGAEFVPGRVRWDGEIVEIDLSELTTRDTAELRLQLLSGDADSGSRVAVQPLSNVVDAEGIASPLLLVSTTPSAAGAAFNLTGLPAADDVFVQVENVRFSSTTQRYTAELRLQNAGDSLGRSIAVAFPDLPSGVTLRNPSGTTPDGDPYINFAPAISRGGLSQNGRSEPLLVEFDDPPRVPFALTPQIVAGANQQPALAAIGPLTVMPGGKLATQLTATDPDGDTITFSLGATPAVSASPDLLTLPTGILRANGLLEFTPEPVQLGEYTFDVIASDGALEARRTVTLSVVADTTTTTRVSGFVLDVDQSPLAGMQVEVGAVQGLTQSDGSFTLDLGSGPVVGDTLKVRGETFSNGGPLVYPFIAEKLPFILEHEVFAGVNNVITRPIFLPPLDVGGGTTIDPMQDTTVQQEVAPGEMAEVFVAAGTLMNQQGTPFTGTLSITEVPPNLTPAALPDGMSTDLVVTIQPGEMVFARPAPLTLPNRAEYPAGKILDLWSINPVTGEFEDVGDAQVSADGQSIETISGGIRNSSWHYVVDPPIASPKRAEKYNPKEGCPACPETKAGTSEIDLHSGALIEMHDLVTYQSQGQSRGVQLMYDSRRADPQPILHFGIDEIDVMDIFPFDVSRVRFSAYLAVARDEFSMAVPGANRGDGESDGAGFAIRHYAGLPDDSHFWNLPEGRGAVDGALQIDLRDQPTGVYQSYLNTGVYFHRSELFHPFTFLGSSSRQVEDLVVVNSIDSPFGAGWGLTGWQQIVEETDRRAFVDGKDRRALIVDGGGTELLFQFDSAQNKFLSPPGDFSTLEQLNDGTYRRTMPDQTVYQFNARLQLATMTDRNHNVMTYGYDGAGKLTSITDPVGLVTSFTYTGTRVTTITDPAQRQTKLAYDSAGNLTRVTDPDDTARNWSYDADHHMTGEVDKLGRTEQAIYGFHGRVTSAVRKDGSQIIVNSPETQSLLMPDATIDFKHAPIMARLTPDAQASYVDGNGNVQRTFLDGAGQSLGEVDAVGANPVVTRDENNLPATRTNARGFESSSTFDDRGNVLTMRDTLSVRLGDEPGLIGLMSGSLQYHGETAHYSFQGQTGDEVYIDYVQGSHSITIRQPSDEAAYIDPGNLPADETFRVDVSGVSTTGNFVARLLAPQESPILPLNTRVDLQAPAGQDFIYRVSLQRGQRLRIEDHTPSNMRTWSARRVDQQPFQQPDLNLTATGTPGIFEAVVQADGEYVIFVVNQPKNDVSLVPFSFTATLTTPAPVAKSGFGIVHSGTLQPNAQEEFSFTALVGTLVYVDYLGTDQSSPSVSLLDAAGQEIYPRFGIARLSSSGTFTAVVRSFSSLETNYSFRLIDVSTVPTVAFGESFNDTVTNGAAVIRRLSGVEGQRWISRAAFDEPVGVIVVSEFSSDPIAGFSFFNKDALLELPATGDYFVIADGHAASESVLFETIDVRAARPIKLDDDLRGTFTLAEPRRYYRFTAKPGTTIYLENLRVSFITEIGLPGEDRTSLPDDRFITLPDPSNGSDALREYYLFTEMDTAQFLPHPFAFHLHDFHESTTPITIGQSVSGNLDFSERDTFTFAGTAGQVLFFDDRDYDAEPDSGMNFGLTPPQGSSGGVGNIFTGPIVLPATGTYQLGFQTKSFRNFDDPLHHDYQFRLFDLREAPIASLVSPLTRTLTNGAAVAAYRFAATTGQRVTFTQTIPATTSLRVYSANGKLLKDSATDPSFTMTFANTETCYLVVAGRDESVTAPVASTWTITDASEPAVTPSGFGTLHEGAASEGEVVATFQGNAGMHILLQQPNDGGFNFVNFHVQGPAGETVADIQVTSGDQFFVLPRSGAYTVRFVGIGSPIISPRTYKFVLSQVQDLPLLALGSIQPVASDNLGTHFRIQGTVGQQLLIDTILPDNVEATSFLGVGASVLDPVAAAPLSSPLVTIPRSGNYVLRASLFNTLAGAVRVLDVATAPQLALDTPATGTRTQVHEDVLLKFSATAKEKRLFQFNTSNWQITNLSHPDRYVSLQLASREISPGNIVWEGVAEFPDSGDYALVSYGRFASPLDYSALMTSFSEPTTPMTGGQLSQTVNTYEPTYNQLISRTDEQGRQTLLDIDPANGNTRSVTRVIGPPGGGDDLVMAMTYTASGQIDTMTDPLGRVTDYDYDARGNLIQVTAAKGTAVEAILQFELDAAGNVTAIIDANGHRTTFEYDALNRRTKMTEPDPDGAGPLLAPVTTFVYNAIGNVTNVTDAAGHTTSQAFDARDRLVAMTDANNQVTHYVYDRNGNVIATTDPLGRTVKMKYDARNRLIASIDAAGFETHYRYDLDDNLLSVTDASGNLTRYDYDARGRRVAEVDPFGNVSTFVYNGVNELVTMTDRLDRVTKMEFDEAGRMTREQWLDAANTVVNTIDYTYDAASRLVRMQDGSSDLRVTFDELDHGTRVESGGVAGVPAAILDATYDLVGNRLTLTDTIQGSLGARNTYLYDAMDRLTRETQASAIGATNLTAEKRIDFKYNVLSQPTDLVRFGDLAGAQPIATSQFTYDTLNRLTDLTHRDAANARLDGFAFIYDATSRITQITDIDGVTDYVYDARDQLTGANHADATNPDETYAYDATGNRTSSQRHGTGYSTGDGNRLATDGTNSFEYDAEGNLIKQTTIASGAVREFAWDHRNRLARVTDRPSAAAAPTQIAEYTYDAMNRRLAKTVGGATTYFIYDGMNVLVDLTDPDSIGPQPATESMRYLHGPAVDQVFAQEDAAGEVEWLLTDHLGTVHDLVDDTGAIVNHLKYDSYGNVISQSNPAAATRYQFTGREFDAETGLHFYRARYYDAALGRFLSEDPIRFTSNDMNLFRYVTNDPLRNVDPYGYQASDGTNEINADVVANVRTNMQDRANILNEVADPNFTGLKDPRENSLRQESLDIPTPEFMEKFLKPPKLSWRDRLRLRFSEEGRQTLCEYDEMTKTFEREVRDAKRQAFRSYLERNYTPKSLEP